MSTSLPMSNPFADLVAMPCPRNPDAPWFHGNDLNLLPFLDDFKDLADSCGLPDELKYRRVMRYADPIAKRLWMALPSYMSHDYQAFRAEILSFYPKSARIDACRRQADEIEQLCQCIHALPIDDPAYATLYVHLNSLSPAAARLCPPPTPVTLQPRCSSAMTDTDHPQQDLGTPLFQEREGSEPSFEIVEVEEVSRATANCRSRTAETSA